MHKPPPHNPHLRFQSAEFWNRNPSQKDHAAWVQDANRPPDPPPKPKWMLSLPPGHMERHYPKGGITFPWQPYYGPPDYRIMPRKIGS